MTATENGVTLEKVTSGASIDGVDPSGPVRIVSAQWRGSSCIEIAYKLADGRTDSRLLYRDDEPRLTLVSSGPRWSFDADGHLFKLAAEAQRIRLAHLFDPLLSVHTSLVDPLPHQITAVYESLIPRQPLRFLLADDPGAGKTIMTGLYIRELMLRGDLKRCMIVPPGMLAEQWQDELWEKFQLDFEIMTRDKLEAARSGNWLAENDRVICRLDMLSRNEDLQEKLKVTDWDLIVVDEAHKMSASFFGGEIKATQRHELGKILGRHCRHFLLLTATPHNGKEVDFQLFMSLLDADRFEGRFRDGVHVVDVSDLMRRMVKEELVKFDGRPLFPERNAYTVSYQLSDLEAALYKEVTDYVKNEFNRAEQLQGDRRNAVGFALTILQRRLASSPEAIYQSLKRRRQRLEERLMDEQLQKRGAEIASRTLTDDEIDDLDDAPDQEMEDLEAEILDQATAAQTIQELKAEIQTLEHLVKLAEKVRRSGDDTKWEKLSDLLNDNPHMRDKHGHLRKLVIFTEHRDTMTYLAGRIRTLLGRDEAVVTIAGGMAREDRRKTQEAFTQEKDVQVLVATDAAGEGINLQRAHLLINYDLPWNPNRLEQRFGRIHRIGQTEVCHMWNLVADRTREGVVFRRLLEKLETESERLGGKVFDVLGLLIEGSSLRKLLIEAIRYGDQPEVRARLDQIVDDSIDPERIKQLMRDNALASDSMDASRLQEIRERMERAEARRLQPHYIEAFFREAFELLGGRLREREPRRFEVAHVPAKLRERDRQIGLGAPLLKRYERITFEKDLRTAEGKPLADFVCPGHPLLDTTTDLTLEQHRNLLKQGSILIDPSEAGDQPRLLVMLDHGIEGAAGGSSGTRHVVSRRLQLLEMTATGEVRDAGYAPYLDYHPASDIDRQQLDSLLGEEWLQRDLDDSAVDWAAEFIVPEHLAEVRGDLDERLDKVRAAVKDRLTKEINHWDHRAIELQAEEEAGKQPKINWQRARARADELQDRLQNRLQQIEEQRNLSPRAPVVVGGALIVPQGLLDRLAGRDEPTGADAATQRERIRSLAVEAVMQAERALGNEPRDVEAEKIGYDVESRVPETGRLRFIEVKGRAPHRTEIHVTRNEILTGLNKPDDFILAIVEVDGQSAAEPRYIRAPFENPLDFAASGVDYHVDKLLDQATPPA